MSKFHGHDNATYDVIFALEMKRCLTTKLWNCTWFTSGKRNWEENKERWEIRQQGKTALMWQSRKNNIAALWLDFDAESYFVTVKHN